MNENVKAHVFSYSDSDNSQCSEAFISGMCSIKILSASFNELVWLIQLASKPLAFGLIICPTLNPMSRLSLC